MEVIHWILTLTTQNIDKFIHTLPAVYIWSVSFIENYKCFCNIDMIKYLWTERWRLQTPSNTFQHFPKHKCLTITLSNERNGWHTPLKTYERSHQHKTRRKIERTTTRIRYMYIYGIWCKGAGIVCSIPAVAL